MRLMVEAQVGIKTHDLSQDGEFLDQQAIGERKQGIDRVARRATANSKGHSAGSPVSADGRGLSMPAKAAK